MQKKTKKKTAPKKTVSKKPAAKKTFREKDPQLFKHKEPPRLTQEEIQAQLDATRDELVQQLSKLPPAWTAVGCAVALVGLINKAEELATTSVKEDPDNATWFSFYENVAGAFKMVETALKNSIERVNTTAVDLKANPLRAV